MARYLFTDMSTDIKHVYSVFIVSMEKIDKDMRLLNNGK